MERTGWECRLDRDLRSRGRGGVWLICFLGICFGVVGRWFRGFYLDFWVDV